MRKVVSFVLAAALFFGGLYLVIWPLLYSPVVSGKLLAMGGFMATVGAGWLWSDIYGD